MKDRILFLLKYCLFWLIFFFIARVFFLFFHFGQSGELPLKVWLGIFGHGLHIDLSMMGYVMLLPGIFVALSCIAPSRFYFFFFILYTLILTFVFSCIASVDMELYSHWGYRMDSTPLLYLKTPKEAMASSSVWVIIRQIIITLVLFVASFYLYMYIAAHQIFNIVKTKWQQALFFLFLTAALVIPIRGGVGIAPMNPGTVYFHKVPFANHAAVNVFWNVAYSLSRTSTDSELKADFMNEKVADSLFHKIHVPGENTPQVLNVEKPNVLIIILESFTSKVIARIGGDSTMTPNFSALIKEGLFFENFYASGDRSDKGLVSILSGYPAQPTSSIVKYPEKVVKLPFLSKVLKSKGYNSAYYYGGDLNFANMKSYLLTGEYDKLVTKENFDKKLDNSKWGVHDQHVFDQLTTDLAKEKLPFFYTYFTLSSHDPFEVPMQTQIQGNDDEQKFRNSILYTDKCLGDFIAKAKQSDWWKNTLVVLLADHGVPYVGKLANHEPAKFHVPMLWLGGALTAKDSVVKTYCAQTDLVATLLSQMKLPINDFRFSRNILAKNTASFAFYCFNNGFGFLTDSTTQVFDNTSAKYLIESGKLSTTNSDYGKAFLQSLAKDFKGK
jgi:phosphoglycerol transferase MdoB-like AlkP superfamily enzyme